VWKEFRGANQKARLYLTGMFVSYLLALFMIARAYTAG
jgi:glucose uptake protein